jgi:hypothetical protein
MKSMSQLGSGDAPINDKLSCIKNAQQMGVGNGEWGIEGKSTLIVLESRFRSTSDSRLPTPDSPTSQEIRHVLRATAY